MNARILVMTVLATSLSVAGGQLVAQLAPQQNEGLQSLRGMNPIDEEARVPETKRIPPDRRPIARDFVQQPPLIPHDTKGYQINLKFNKCLTCHSWANYEEARATKISQSHFVDRDGIALANVSASRYFCNQCHVQQRDADLLVENEFKSVDVLQ